ncbi:uncharacterized protein TOT_030000129 [Theileria orientalis strain Shintoku]|uniref:Serine aminopeptidase S33 domain-containing protein n=1 Tax=Theileria orientalis strain Shintoku TaxID=869250 RepID=J4C8I9_THEOR|nr:uncharacterized protein TOT_030000129 [Theileria orientalis strain Shintoku]PVC53434.1 hypothetical protein MACL_00000064 [Theileria orientalis]BAM40868.1 uncharacterized protein TOT_030000129 [Theileria orientalis strain Shintoku]|eukprot:XP_009691169.1 uncharacterized protein TOT_030000129 [Theileria orientalis strain Shintoku]
MQNQIRPNVNIKRKPIAVTLDVTDDVDEDKFELFKQLPHGILTHTYIPAKNCKLVSVLEKSVPVWTLKNKDETCKKVSVANREGPKYIHIAVTTEEGIEGAYYYIKDKKGWKQVSGNVFYYYFDLLALNKSVLDYVTLNVNSEVDRNHFLVNATREKPYVIIVPTPGYVLSRVFDGINTIWKSRNYEDHCTFVNIFYSNKKPALIHLVIMKGKAEEKQFFKKVPLAWKQIAKSEYVQCLKEHGMNLNQFNNNITFDYTNVDRTKYRIERTYNVNILSETFMALPGYSVKRVVDSGRTVWESDGSFQCVFARFYSRNREPFLCYLLVTDSEENKVLYYAKNGEKWSAVDKKTYDFVLSNKDDPIYTHRGIGVDSRGNRKLLMSHFRNKQGLLIRTYCASVDNPKGNIILIHGSWGHFRSNFCEFDMEWNYDRFGYPVTPYMKDFTSIKTDSFYKNIKLDEKTNEVYKEIFGWSELDGRDAFEMSPRFQYSGSFLESLNNMGYCVYGMDLQSQGLSDSVSDLKFYINDFKDYVNDVLQFVDIVKRGNFENTKEAWREEFVYSVSADNIDLKCYLSGFSLGGNIAIQAAQEFYKHAKPGVKFVDGVFILSGMLNIDNNIDTFAKKFTIGVIKLISLMSPRTQNPLETKRVSDSFESFSRYKDPSHYSDRIFYKTVELLFGACKEVLRNIKYYPDKIPTLFIHVSNDPLCDVTGQRNVVYNHLKNKCDVKLVELEGNSHAILSPDFFPNVTPIINEWFLSHSSKSSIIIK